MKPKNWMIVKIVGMALIAIICVSAGIAIGKISVRPVEQQNKVTCPMCSGSGILIDDKTRQEVKCPECNGTGKTDIPDAWTNRKQLKPTETRK